MNAGSQIMDGHLQTNVLEGTSNPYQAEWNSLFCRKFYLQHLKSLAIKGDLKACHFRSICWKVFLKCLPENKLLWIDTVKSQRQNYEEILDKYATNPRTVDSMDINVNNPLSQAQQNPWIQYFEDTELKTTIEQDVVRTFPEIDFFHKKNIQVMMTSILFSYAREFPDVSYKQGMHEILAPILLVLKYDVEGYLEYSKENKLDLELHILLNQNYIEHDTYFLFCQLMNSVEAWYTISNPYDKPIAAEPFTQKISSFPTNCLGLHLRRIYEQLLKHHDNELFQRLEELEITPQIFGIRWLRLLFGREFSMPDLLIVWDALFADSIALDLVDFIFVGMLKAIRYLLLPCDYASCLTYLMRYPNVADVRFIIDLALHLRDPNSYHQPMEKVVNPLQLKAAKDNKFPAASKINSLKLPSKVTSYVNKVNDKRPNSLSVTLCPSVIAADSSVGKSSLLVEPLNYDLNQDQTELDFVEEYYDTSMPSTSSDDSFPRTMISNVMESKSSADQVSKIINEDLPSCLTDVSKTSIREMVTLSRPKESFTRKPLLKKEKHSTKDVSLGNLCEKEIYDLRLVINCCAKQLTQHLDKLQKTMLSQSLLHEEEMYLALAGLKRVRDILKGTVCIAEVIEDDFDPYSIYDSSNSVPSQNNSDFKREVPKEIKNSEHLLTENGNDASISQCSVSVATNLEENLIPDNSYRTVNGANTS